MNTSENQFKHDEIEQFQTQDSTADPHDETEIYESGKLHSIKIEELINNKVAIKQLLNNYKTSMKKEKDLSDKLYEKKADVEYYKTSPFISILSGIFNVISTLISGIGVNIATSQKDLQNIGISICVVAAIGTVISSLWPVLYPYAKDFFNKKI